MFTFNFTVFDADFIFSCWGISITFQNYIQTRIFEIVFGDKPLFPAVFPWLHLCLQKMLVLAFSSPEPEISSLTLFWKQSKRLLLNVCVTFLMFFFFFSVTFSTFQVVHVPHILVFSPHLPPCLKFEA